MPSQHHKEKFTLTVGKGDRGQRLDLFLAAQLPAQCGFEVSRRRLRRLIERGAVYVDRKRTRIASRPLRAGAAVEVYWDGAAPSRRAGHSLLTPDNILYEDQDVIAVNKPSGMPTQATVDDVEDHLVAHLQRLLAERDGIIRPYLALHHRLDRGTSGVVVLARSQRANAGLAEAFRERQVIKIYRALCLGSAETASASGAFVVCDRLQRGRDPRTGRRMMVASIDNGQEAVSEFRLCELLAADQGQYLALIEARPRTGRTHQLRVHLAGAGWPVLGDRLYGGRSGAVGRLRLHAQSLELTHPVSGRRLVVECPLPSALTFHHPPIRTRRGVALSGADGLAR